MSENFNDWDHQDPKKWITQGYIVKGYTINARTSVLYF
jgi:hypothetical protein